MTLAYCDRSGVICFTSGKLPDGMLPVFKGSDKVCRDKVSATARHAYDGETLLVPGIPEAVDDDHALEALQLHRAWISGDKSKALDARRKAWMERLLEAMS